MLGDVDVHPAHVVGLNWDVVCWNTGDASRSHKLREYSMGRPESCHDNGTGGNFDWMRLTHCIHAVYEPPVRTPFNGRRLLFL